MLNLRTDRIEQLTFLELIRLSVSHFGVADLTDGKSHVSMMNFMYMLK